MSWACGCCCPSRSSLGRPLLGGADGNEANDTTRTLSSGISTSEVVNTFDEASLRLATSNFSDNNKVDEGTFGIVYVGTLSRQAVPALNGIKVAIKVLKFKADPKKNRDGEKGFEKEVEVLGKYSHPNVVRLFGRGKALLQPSCTPAPCLVYEFMSGGSLKQRLRPASARMTEQRHRRASSRSRRVPASPPSAALSVRERYGIAADVARGLAFLHDVCDPVIVHQDVKTANILLGPGGHRTPLVAKLADFGTVRMVSTHADATHVSTIHIAGTRPYMPPESFQAGHISPKTDSYAFGVVLLELLTGRHFYNKQTQKTLVSDMRPVLDSTSMQDELPPVLDRLAGRWDKNEACQLGAIAKSCLEPRVRHRATVASLCPTLDRLARREVAGTRVGGNQSRPWWSLMRLWDVARASRGPTEGAGNGSRLGSELVLARGSPPLQQGAAVPTPPGSVHSSSPPTSVRDQVLAPDVRQRSQRRTLNGTEEACLERRKKSGAELEGQRVRVFFDRDTDESQDGVVQGIRKRRGKATQHLILFDGAESPQLIVLQKQRNSARAVKWYLLGNPQTPLGPEISDGEGEAESHNAYDVSGSRRPFTSPAVLKEERLLQARQAELQMETKSLFI
eukprot:g1106.t1